MPTVRFGDAGSALTEHADLSDRPILLAGKATAVRSVRFASYCIKRELHKVSAMPVGGLVPRPP